MERFNRRRIFDIGVQQGKTDAIKEYHKEMHDIVEGDEEFTDWQKHEILLCNDCVLEQLEEQKKDE